MAGRAGLVGLLIATLVLALLPLPAWAGSSQTALAVSVIVSPRCAVRTPASLIPNEVSAAPSSESVAMRCTKGALPVSAPSGTAASTVGPRITRDLVLTAATEAPAAPRPLTETTSNSVAEVAAPRVVITVNF